MGLIDTLSDIGDAIRAKTGGSAPIPLKEMAEEISGIQTKESVSWHQCPTLVRKYLDEVTYDPSDYSTSEIGSYAPASPVLGNTKPIGKTVDGVTYYNEIPNTTTPFASENTAGTLEPLDALRWLNTATSNVRDLGGWACDGGTVQYGKLFRGGEADASDKHLMVDIIGVKHELQLRGTEEAPQPYSVWDIPFTCPEQYVWYQITDRETWKEILRCVFDTVPKGLPLYFHCSAGADRTGTVACLLEALLGVSQSDIDKDYELTCFATGSGTEQQARRRDESEWKGLISAIKAVPLLGGLTDSFRNRAVSFVLSLGFTAAEINAFRTAMIDGTPGEITPSFSNYSVTNTLTHAETDNPAVSAVPYQPYEAEIKAESGYAIASVQITVGGADVTEKAWRGEKTLLYRAVGNTLEHCTTNNPAKAVIAGQSYAAEITADEGYTLDGATVILTMGGINVSEYYSGGRIAIPNVTGNIAIQITAVPSAPLYTNLANPTAASWKTDYRLNSSVAETAADGHFVCNDIPCHVGDVIRIRGVLAPQGNDNCYAINPDSSKVSVNALSGVYAAGHCAYDSETKTITYTLYLGTGGVQQSAAANSVGFRGSFTFASGVTENDIIITINEEIV